MEYLTADFNIACADGLLQTARDLLADAAAGAGFESFEDTDSGLRGYVQKSLFDKSALDEAIADFPLPGTTITYTVAEAENKDWNAAWEAGGFEPVVIKSPEATAQSPTPTTKGPTPTPPPNGEGHKVLQDTLAETQDNRAAAQDDINVSQVIIEPYKGDNTDGKADQSLPTWGRDKGGAVRVKGGAVRDNDGSILRIAIDARLAFGTGTHETTQMMVSTLLGMNLRGKRVLDCGCGTGILGIVASKLGAAGVVAYDIDEWSVSNTRHNAQLNGVGNIEVRLGDSGVLASYPPTFDVAMANINRNILLQDMDRIASRLAQGGRLVLSGFYEEDVPLLTQKADTLGLKLVGKRSYDGWQCIVLG